MRKLSILFFIGIFFTCVSSKSLASNISPSIDMYNTGNDQHSARVVCKFWFKSIPPETYQGKTKIKHYKNNGGYMGVYI